MHHHRFLGCLVLVVDLSGLAEAWLSFRLAAAHRRGARNRLRVFVFEDCSAFHSTLLYDKAGTELSTYQSEESWFPISAAEWRYEFVDLSEYIDKKINLLFVATTEQGPSNNLYLDDLMISEEQADVSTSSDHSRPWVVVFPNPIRSMGVAHFLFNLDTPQQVRISCVDLSGRLLMEKVFDNAEAQILKLPIHLPSDQVYLLKLEALTQKHVLRLIVN